MGRKIVDIIRQDIATGENQTYKTVAKELGHTEGLTQIDVKTGLLCHRKILRVHLHDFVSNTGPISDLSIGEVTSQGYPKGDSRSIFSYPGKNNQPTTTINGSSAGDMDGGDLRITPQQLASRVESVLKSKNRRNL